MRGVAGLDNAGLGHFQPEVVAFAGALANSGEDRESSMLLGYVVDQLHNDDGFAHACAAEQADFAAFQKWLYEVDNLHAGFEHLRSGRLFIEERRRAVDRHGHLVVDGAELIDRFADHVHDAAERARADGYGNGSALVDGFHTADHALGRFHGNAAGAAFAKVLLHLEDDIDRRGNVEAVAHNAKRLIDRRHVSLVKLHVDYRAGDLNYVSNIFCHKTSAFSF